MRLKAMIAASVLALNVSANAFAQEAQEAPVPPVRLSQVGFETDGRKIAVAASEATTPLDWRVVDASGAVAASGSSEPFGMDDASGQAVHRIDFSGVTAAGEGYRLIVGEMESRPFTISERPWAGLAADAASYFYQNRSGIEIAAAHVERPDLARPAAHVDETLTCFSGEDMNGNVWPGCDYSLNVGGGWYDAGDHGKYVVNGGIALWTLLNAHERFGMTTFADGALALPEAGNGVGDLLDEARWQMEFMLAMQVPDGARLSVPVGRFERGAALTFTGIDAGGMAHHKAHDVRWTALPMAPHDDPEKRFLYAPSTAATLNLAATAARCARVWREVDPAFSARCLTAARRAFAAAERNPEVYAVGSFHGGGNYGDEDVGDEFYWAAAELYAATGEQAFADRLRSSLHFPDGQGAAGNIAWPATASLGTLTLASVETGLSDEEGSHVRAALIAAADGYLTIRDAEGFAVPFGEGDYNWGSNGDFLNRAMILAVAHDLTGQARYREGVVDVMDYVLGRNVLDRSYVSGWGARPMMNPHHRFWAHMADPAWPLPPAGALSGGANSRAMTDPVAEAMQGSCAPQACWADHFESYAMNEVAINWNAPLAWVAAWLDQ
ncbi:MAG: endoglucanase [Brevundimonas sp.]|jgi:endoglucanase|uniref:glycoside hydrolase family 9 protein n=1 Tax=Brevundimonas sp. TaxID=1871086 RepID=UPI0039E5ABE7